MADMAGKTATESPWRETAKIITQALILATVVRVFFFQPFNIPSGSMKETLLVGDYLFVSKLSYGLSRYSFPWGMIPFDGRIFASAPKRGDVVVFKLPRDNSTDYIKRVIGLPGDHVELRDGVVYQRSGGATLVWRKRAPSPATWRRCRTAWQCINASAGSYHLTKWHQPTGIAAVQYYVSR
jgi:signal peptidase I